VAAPRFARSVITRSGKTSSTQSRAVCFSGSRDRRTPAAGRRAVTRSPDLL